MKKHFFASAMIAAIALAAPLSAKAEELPDEMIGRWCAISSQWESAVFAMFAQSQCDSKDGTGFVMTKTTQSFFGPEPQMGYPNNTCTIDQITKLEDEHYLVRTTCREHGVPDAMHPNRGEPSTNEAIWFVDTCGRMQLKEPEYCHPHCDAESEPPPEACRVS
jgi:hypothetical protein